MENEIVGNKQEAVDAYKIGWKLAKEYLGEKNSLTISLKSSFQSISVVRKSQELID